MSNYSLKIDLTKLRGAQVTDLNYGGRIVRCLTIPVVESGLYEGKKGTYLDLRMVESNGQYGDTHFLKQEVSSEVYKSMNEEQRSAIPIVGNAKPAFSQQAPQPSPTTQAPPPPFPGAVDYSAPQPTPQPAFGQPIQQLFPESPTSQPRISSPFDDPNY